MPLPTQSGRHDAASQPNFVTVCDPLILLSLKAPVSGRWAACSREGFNFRVSIHPTNGLVLHQLSYRMVTKTAQFCIAQRYQRWWCSTVIQTRCTTGSTYLMRVGKYWFVDQFFDPGCDRLGEIHYFDHNVVNWNGTAAPSKMLSACMRKITASCGSTMIHDPIH